MNIQFPIFDMTIDGEDDLGLTAISFVSEPAIQQDFVYFSAERSMIALADEEKREIVSPILIPNQLILRVAEDGTYYYIRWTADVIKQLAFRYLYNGWFNNFTVMHPTFYNSELTYEDVLENDVEMLRMWTIEDAESYEINTKYGFNLPNGTLCVHLHVGNDEIWNRIKSGELRGLSIEAFTSYKISQSKMNDKMEFTKENVSLFEKFLSFMNSVRDDAEAIVEQTKKDEAESGEVTIKYWIDNEHYFTVDAEGYVRDEEMNLIDSGKYLLMDGNVLEVGEDNKFVGTATAEAANEEKETIEAPIAEEKVEIAQEEVKIDDNVEEVEEKVDEPQDEVGNVDADADVQDGGEDIEETLDPISEAKAKVMIGEVEFSVDEAVANRIKELEKQLEDANTEMVKMSEVTPSVEPLQAPINANADSDNLSNVIRLLNSRR